MQNLRNFRHAGEERQNFSNEVGVFEKERFNDFHRAVGSKLTDETIRNQLFLTR